MRIKMVQKLRVIGVDASFSTAHRYWPDRSPRRAPLKDFQLPMLLPGIRINTSPTDFYPIKQVQLMSFDGRQWIRFGEVLGR